MDDSPTHSGDAPARNRQADLAGNPAHLELQDLRAGYGKMEVIRGIDLGVQRGQSVCLVGPNGAGKSTVLNAIFGLAEIFSGRIVVADQDVTGVAAERKPMIARLGNMLQTDAIFAD